MSGAEEILHGGTFREVFQFSQGPDEQIRARFVSLFLQEAAGLILEAHFGAAEDDAARVGQAAHALRGASALIGARRLAAYAEALEYAAEGEAASQLRPGVELISGAFAELRPLLLSMLPPVGSPS